MGGSLLWVVAMLMALLPSCECKDRVETLTHYGVKIGFWFLLGVTLGVYFQARMNLKELMRPVIDVVLYALLIAVAVYALFTIGELVENVL
jgi:cell division protein FtsW (lipid II flippase)